MTENKKLSVVVLEANRPRVKTKTSPEMTKEIEFGHLNDSETYTQVSED